MPLRFEISFRQNYERRDELESKVVTSSIHRSVCSRIEYTIATCNRKLQYVIFAPTLLLSCIRIFNGIMIPQSCVCVQNGNLSKIVLVMNGRC